MYVLYGTLWCIHISMLGNYWSKSYILCGQTYIRTTHFRFLASNSYIAISSHRTNERTFTSQYEKDEKKWAKRNKKSRFSRMKWGDKYTRNCGKFTFSLNSSYSLEFECSTLSSHTNKLRTVLCVHCVCVRYVLSCIRVCIYTTYSVTSSHFLFFIFNFIYVSYIIIACHITHTCTALVHTCILTIYAECLVPFIITQITIYRWIQRTTCGSLLC